MCAALRPGVHPCWASPAILGGRVTFFACTKKVTKEMHPRLRAGGEAAGSLRSAGVWRQGSCPVAKCGPSWPAPRAAHAALSGRPSPLHRGSTSRAKQRRPYLLRQEPRLSFASRVPSRSRRAGGGKARRVAGRMPASLRPVHGRTVRKPRSLLAQSRGHGCPRDRDLEGAFLWLLSLCKQRK